MQKILVIQHIDCEPLSSFSLAGKQATDTGRSRESALRANFDHIRAYRGDDVPASLDGWDALIILGGPMAVYDMQEIPYLRDELKLIEKALTADVPTLGICLGAQLIAAAAGARVYAGPVKEIGWSTVELTKAAATDVLFSTLPATFPVFQLHGDTFDLPSGATRLATDPVYENQAFRIGSRVYGLQFHVEVTEELVRLWVREYEDYLGSAGVKGQTILDGLPDYADTLLTLSHRLIGRFLELVPRNSANESRLNAD
ncbi:MAG: gamma-glutamyl-gamma-aminobutyrate hydrolase family protein [Thermoleophilia bacterium]|jgi:GMP synthase-like glutamine amidotransferase